MGRPRRLLLARLKGPDMALYTFGGNPGAVLTDAAGNVVPDYPLNIRVAGTGELVTALFEADGTTPIGALRSNPASAPAPGAIRTFKATDVQAIEYEFLDADGQPVRWYETGREIATAALQAAQAAQTEVGDKLDKTDGGTVAGPVIFEAPISAPNLGDISASRIFAVKGAAGDGTTDDAPAIQAALDAAYAAGGGIVLIPGGRTYGVGTFLVVKARTTVWAYGATIRSIHYNRGVLRNFMPEDSFTGYTGHSRIAIYGGVWDGNASDGAGTGLVTGTTNIACFIHCRDITVRDAVFLDTSSAHALEFNAVDGGRALNCRFEGFRDNSGDGSRLSSEAIQIDIAKSGSSSIPAYDGTPCKNIIIADCWFGPSVRLGAFGRAVGSHAQVAGQYFENITIEGNVIEGALETGIHGWCWRRAHIRGNTIRGTADSGIYVSVPDPAAGTVYTSYGITVEGNIIEGTVAGSGIRVLGYDTAPITDIVITGNTIRGAVGTTANGIQPQCTPNVVVSGNIIDSVQSTGIFPQYSDGANLTGNTVTATSSNGINVAGCTGASITGNIINTTGSNHGIVIGGGTDGRTGAGALVVGNRIEAAAVAGIRVSQTGCHIAGNKVAKGAGTTANGVSLTSTAIGCTIIDNDLSGNGWTTAAAIVTSTAAPVTSSRGTTALPGSNIVNALAAPALATVVNSTATGSVVSVPIPAGDATPGATYRLTVHGTASTTGTPTLALDIALGGTQLMSLRGTVATGAALAAVGWDVELLLTCVTSGAPATWTGRAVLTSRLTSGAAGALVQDLGLINSTVTKDSTAAQTLTVRATWGAASASNTISATAAAIDRVG
ncbi:MULTISPECIES: right-handed parallel beta-helix repeat-containing protein [unclassified Streptomyces]|uniref:right-handed parallel beta-helix repeat-containing protein n=1 Tax=unclassified Streptomyces TaxID=2593676 RepID=UPI00343F45A4